ncbi:hypothetical protein BaRGS_00036823 [Batillaria attramentaria]|uniref:Uncharacterized protein n=1 Tax=Batillaria attramentaria TaxID=370345 RepID=A0ABD0JAB6_9CAEN
MPGRMNGLEADGEWSDASDDAVKSGSATDASRGDMDDTSSRLAGSKLSLSSFTGSSLTKRDPVHSILDKIDAELAAMSSPSPQASPPAGRLSTTRRTKSSLPPLLPKADRTHAGKGPGGQPQGASDADQQQQQHISGSAEIYTDAALTDNPTDGTFFSLKHPSSSPCPER